MCVGFVPWDRKEDRHSNLNQFVEGVPGCTVTRRDTFSLLEASQEGKGVTISGGTVNTALQRVARHLREDAENSECKVLLGTIDNFTVQYAQQYCNDPTPGDSTVTYLV